MTALNGNEQGCARCETIPSKIEGDYTCGFPSNTPLTKSCLS